MAKVKYCTTPLQKYFPCQLMWSLYNGVMPINTLDPNVRNAPNVTNCTDEPMEENCKNIVDSELIKCPICGGGLK